MVKWLKVACLAVVALLVAASASGTDSNTYNYQGTGPYFNPKSGNKVNSTGDVKVEDAFPNRDQNFTFSNIINSASIAAASADSSAILDVHNMRLGTLLFKVTPVTGNPGITRLAVQVRIHLNGGSDSLSTFAVYSYGSGPTFAAGALDTTLAGHLLTGSATVPWSGETIVQFNVNRNSPLDAVAAVPFSYPNGVAIPLSNFTGRDFYADYISIRVRNVTGPAAKVALSLIGSPN